MPTTHPVIYNKVDLFEPKLGEAFNDFWSEVGNILADKPPPFRNEIHHYTDIDAAISIIENKTVWSSNIAFLNDANEMQAARNLLTHIAYGENLSSKIKNDAFAKEILEKLIFKIKNEAVHATFIVSFCDSGDLLSQWRGYGAGVSISFFSDKMSTYYPNTSLVKVIYDPSNQIKILESLIWSAKSWLEKQKNQKDYESIEADILIYLRTYFENLAAKMKDYSFREENEWRLITRREIMDLNSKPEVYFRSRKKSVTPYIHLTNSNEPLPISCITLSPNAANTIEWAFRALLDKNGLRDCPVKRSLIPFRD